MQLSIDRYWAILKIVSEAGGNGIGKNDIDRLAKNIASPNTIKGILAELHNNNKILFSTESEGWRQGQKRNIKITENGRHKLNINVKENVSTQVKHKLSDLFLKVIHNKPNQPTAANVNATVIMAGKAQTTHSCVNNIMNNVVLIDEIKDFPRIREIRDVIKELFLATDALSYTTHQMQNTLEYMVQALDKKLYKYYRKEVAKSQNKMKTREKSSFNWNPYQKAKLWIKVLQIHLNENVYPFFDETIQILEKSGEYPKNLLYIINLKKQIREQYTPVRTAFNKLENVDNKFIDKIKSFRSN